jgi:glutaredoxin
MIVIYSKENCPFCTRAVNLAEQKNLKYTVTKIGKDIPEKEFHEIFPNARTVPQIESIDYNGNEYIGGYAEFENWVLTKALGGMTL